MVRLRWSVSIGHGRTVSGMVQVWSTMTGLKYPDISADSPDGFLQEQVDNRIDDKEQIGDEIPHMKSRCVRCDFDIVWNNETHNERK